MADWRSVEFEDFVLGSQVGRMALDLSLRLSTHVEKAYGLYRALKIPH